MIKHVVFFKFKPEIGAAEREQALADLRALPEKIEEIREFQVGTDVLRTPRSWDAVLVSAFDSLETLGIYARHEAHAPIVARFAELCAEIGAVDYEYHQEG